MVIDTSALGAVIFQEADRRTYMAAMLAAPRLSISAATLVEATSVCIREDGSEDRLKSILRIVGAEVASFDAAQCEIARAAYRHYGKGRHPARLNLGDTFSYALAIHLNEPLLFKGNDFARTDVTPAI